VRDLSVAGYNVTLNKATATSAATDYSRAAERTTQLVQAFATPEDLATWTASVLGDQRIFLCSGIEGCPGTTSAATATGLRPKYEAEVDALAPRLATMAEGTGGSYADLVQVGAPGMGISPQLLEALRRLPPAERGVAINRLAQEMAIYRTIDRALIARNALIAGLSLPEAAAAAEVAKDMQTKVDRLDRYIDDMMREFRIRKEMTGTTALTILGDSLVRGSQAVRVPDGQRPDANPLERGAVARP
jgi:integrating conjugative element protein (TIGR03755 family)